jgi:hypothetical protein
MLFFGRGAGGKSMTALDVSGVGAFTRRYYQTSPPIPLWSRGNPDQIHGVLGGDKNGSDTDFDAYAKMGETWSMPAVGYISAGKSGYGTDRNPALDPGCTGSKCSAGGPEFVLYMGSGYGEVHEGTTFYTLDALTGDVIATADVEAAASAAGLSRSFSWRNALVANAVGWNPAAFTILEVEHLAATWPDDGMQIRRVYIGDLYGRLWKILPLAPNVAIPMADLGADQPVATAVSVLALPAFVIDVPPPTQYPYVYVTSGADTRQPGPFKIFGFKDEGDDSTTTVDDAVTNGSSDVSTFPPTSLIKNEAGDFFVREFDQGDPMAECGYTTEAFFRGTVQPATTFEVGAGAPVGRVFFGATRLSPPNTKYAPPTPLACGSQGEYPCRSQFDSIIYALKAADEDAGGAAYDLNSSGDDAYRIFRDSRVTALTMQGDPGSGGQTAGSILVADEGIQKRDKTTGLVAPPKAPPAAGIGVRKAPSILFKATGNMASASVRFGSSVCAE